MNKVYVVGLGPGGEEFMTAQARAAMERADVLCGYTVYVDLVKHLYPGKETYVTPMTRELERCRWALETAAAGRTVAMVCSGDAGVYGMAGPLLQLAGEYGGAEVEVVPGVTSALSGAAVLGAPQEELQSVLEQRGLARYFTGICGTPPAKAELLKGIVRKERIDPADAVMVGDATTDSDAAEAAETLFYGRGPFFENTAYPHGSDLTGLNRWLEELAGNE